MTNRPAPKLRSWNTLNAIKRKAGVMHDKRKEKAGAKKSLIFQEW